MNILPTDRTTTREQYHSMRRLLRWLEWKHRAAIHKAALDLVLYGHAEIKLEV